MNTERFTEGMKLLQEIDGEAGQAVIDSLADIAPDVGRFIVEFAFGDIYSRDSLSLRDRELATIVSLCTQGACEPQLALHIKGALNAGLSQREIIEAFTQCIPYVGFPRVLNAIATARSVFESAPRPLHI